MYGSRVITIVRATQQVLHREDRGRPHVQLRRLPVVSVGEHRRRWSGHLVRVGEALRGGQQHGWRRHRHLIRPRTRVC
jgi:hypothetical protein